MGNAGKLNRVASVVSIPIYVLAYLLLMGLIFGSYRVLNKGGLLICLRNVLLFPFASKDHLEYNSGIDKTYDL